MKTVAQTLREAADLIEPEGKWTQEAFARDVAGNKLTFGISEDAACWCLLGAVERASNSAFAAFRITKFVRRAIGGDENDPDYWNDAPERTQAEVVAKLREAAALAEARGL
jgi:hypothetical protein